ncbi:MULTISPECIES: ActS/PrrB/RegB family redox-sensitive histidine kinase [unclassified Paracoccus (in: a-proteobacteria)]|uniref:ActS/PrrB/RegB family redox-sensitive histidine kinase n=1 Tax=unclassified Paracoccus (in: a-proteobacteria) TaxID=2688777 RepID=UPI001602AFCD|nr:MULTISPECIES: ActS/PrrB/RegB family redox-sensitive histidine kinase [unclassified Paracoccus (in: a-proteobacteria)]MBB1492077.1 ActS/PrrB/RegB family redox-sensitive histidine kinase [Paracoccus sp. MC1854]MBB1497963.1 ActS/PrrB/RegB family redox-sensitive histidine kinase [Paracoccus sp. MC1862]QQO44347.1 ActS/PrrB/RegB family redox-sensitive histidine kinase [Paracoccus sp. MC1862]
MPPKSQGRHEPLPGAARPGLRRLAGAGPIRPRRLITARWIALAGQAAAAAGAWGLGARFPLMAVLLVLAAAIAMNLLLTARSRPVDARHALAQLVFDTLQTGALLTLTGGIGNPFALFVLAPLTIGATVLPLRHILALAVATTAMLIAMTALAVPLTFLPDMAPRPEIALHVGRVLELFIGGAFFALCVYGVSADLRATSDALAATQMGLAREQRLQHLGGVVAAAAHEMGTPLATIKLIAGELADEFADRPEIAADLAELRRSVDRCRDILRGMGRAGKDDLLLHSAPLADVLGEAAGPHSQRGVRIAMDLGAAGALAVQRDAGLIHAIRNLIQNAVDFAAAQVEINASRARGRITVEIRDDGPGYPPHLLGRLGEPYLSTRKAGSAAGPYEGMGLGLFIARTLLERSGGTVAFFNRDGAVARVSWPEDAILADDRAALGPNPTITD